MTIKARIHSAEFVVAEPTELPEGTEVDLLPLDPGDRLDPKDRTALQRKDLERYVQGYLEHPERAEEVDAIRSASYAALAKELWN